MNLDKFMPVVANLRDGTELVRRSDAVAAINAPSVQAEPVAWTPIHPRMGPLWANTTGDPSQERLPASYPLLPLYTTPATCVECVQHEQTRAALVVSARKALAAWDSTVLLQSNDGMMQEAMERLRAALAATKDQP